MQSAVTLRFAFPDDDAALARLAALDSAGPPPQPVLVAEVGGEFRAALSLSDGAVVADTLCRTLELVHLQKARAAQLSGPSESGRRGRVSVRARFAKPVRHSA